jgi:hypothetical protein
MHKIVEMADSVAEWEAVHGHEGRTRIAWDDEADEPEPEKKKTVLDED